MYYVLKAKRSLFCSHSIPGETLHSLSSTSACCYVLSRHTTVTHLPPLAGVQTKISPFLQNKKHTRVRCWWGVLWKDEIQSSGIVWKEYEVFPEAIHNIIYSTRRLSIHQNTIKKHLNLCFTLKSLGLWSLLQLYYNIHIQYICAQYFKFTSRSVNFTNMQMFHAGNQLM